MVQETTVTSKVKRPRPRPLSMAQVGQQVAAGATIRQGTRINGAFPVWEWQVFDSNGEFVAAVAASALPQAITAYGFDRRPGVNR